MPATLDQRYEFLDEIGQGGMAVVYRGRDTKLRRDVAIKVLRPDVTANENIVRAFHREAAATSTLSHPNIVSLYDFGEMTDGRLYMIIELLRGSSLAAILDRHREQQLLMPWPRIVAIAVQVCAALSAAHARGIVHHDITPGNIFCIEGQGIRGDHVKVLDFGIARLTETQAVTVATLAGRKTGEELKGTPFYIAPEILMSRPTDHRVDIYGLGAVLYEMCTNLRPFNQQNLYALLLQIASAALIPPTAANPDCDLSQAAEDAVLAALERDPGDRPQTADALARLLEASLGASAPADVAPRRTTAAQPVVNIGLDLTLPHLGPSPIPASTQPLPSLSSSSLPAPQKPVTRPVAAVTAAIAEPTTLADPGEPEPSTTSARSPSRGLWPALGLGLGLGTAAALGFLANSLLNTPVPQPPVEVQKPQSETPPGTTQTPPPAPTKRSPERVRRDRITELEARLSDRKKSMRDCLKNSGAMMGVLYALPITVDIAADGAATAQLDESNTPGALLVPKKSRKCVLDPAAERYAPADLPVQIQHTAPVET